MFLSAGLAVLMAEVQAFYYFLIILSILVSDNSNHLPPELPQQKVLRLWAPGFSAIVNRKPNIAPPTGIFMRLVLSSVLPFIAHFET